jgi:iron complex outermembrane receptor protein
MRRTVQTLLAIPFACTALAASAVELNVPAQSLEAALTDFAEQANVRLIYDASLTRTQQVPALQGDYSVSDGLQRLLQGSGLTYRIDADGTVTLQPLPPAGGAVELGATTVSGVAEGRTDLPQTYAGGDVARGARIGLLGNQDMQDVPFSVSSYTSQLIKNRQAQSLGDVLESDPAVRQSNGFGNFSQVFVIRGFQLYSDDISFNGLYGVLPRQIISTEAVERVEVFKGSNAFLNGVSPGGSGVGGGVNIVSKHAEDTPTRSVTLDYTSSDRVGGHIDLGQRFGEDNQFGVRVNMAKRDGETAVDDEHQHFSLLAVGLDYRGERLRVSTDFGYQKQRVNEGRSVVYLTPATLHSTPKVPDADSNFSQPWAYSQLEDTFGMATLEYDLNDTWTLYGAAGGKYTRENGVYSSLYVSRLDGTGSVGRLYAPRDEESQSALGGLRGSFDTGPVSHKVNFGLSGNWREWRSANESTAAGNRLPGNLYDPFPSPEPVANINGDIHDPRKTGSAIARSAAVSDTLGFLDDRVLFILGIRRQQIVTNAWDARTGRRTSDYDQSINTPVYGLVIKPTDYLSFYANRIEGLSPGQVSTAAGNPGVTFPPYRSKQIEAGIKLDWHTFGASFGVFRIEQPQLVTEQRPTGLNGASQAYSSVDAEQRNRGIEVSVFGEPLPGLRLLAGGTWVDSELRGTVATVNGVQKQGANDGNRGVGVPEFQYNVSADWDVPGVQGLAVNGLMLRTGGQYYDSANDLGIPAWTRFDLGARYGFKMDERDITLRAGVENVANEAYWKSANGSYLTQGAPRTLKVSATVDF